MASPARLWPDCAASQLLVCGLAASVAGPRSDKDLQASRALVSAALEAFLARRGTGPTSKMALGAADKADAYALTRRQHDRGGTSNTCGPPLYLQVHPLHGLLPVLLVLALPAQGGWVVAVRAQALVSCESSGPPCAPLCLFTAQNRRSAAQQGRAGISWRGTTSIPAMLMC